MTSAPPQVVDARYRRLLMRRPTSELLANLPEPDGTPVGVGRDALLAELPEPVGPSADRSLADHLLADLHDPISAEPDLADQAADITVRLDRLQEPPVVDDGLGIDLW